MIVFKDTADMHCSLFPKQYIVHWNEIYNEAESSFLSWKPCVRASEESLKASLALAVKAELPGASTERERHEIGLETGSWRRLSGGTPYLSTGRTVCAGTAGSSSSSEWDPERLIASECLWLWRELSAGVTGVFLLLSLSVRQRRDADHHLAASPLRWTGQLRTHDPLRWAIRARGLRVISVWFCRIWPALLIVPFMFTLLAVTKVYVVGPAREEKTFRCVVSFQTCLGDGRKVSPTKGPVTSSSEYRLFPCSLTWLLPLIPGD